MGLIGGGVTGQVRRLGASLLALGRIRLELLSIEIEEEKQRIAALLLWTVVTALMACFGAVFVALALTVALWETHRLWALGVSAALFVGLAAIGVLRLQRLARADKPFALSVAELRRDAEGLQSPPSP